MGRIPIRIDKIKVDDRIRLSTQEEPFREKIKYLVKIEETGQKWERTFICEEKDLVKLKQEIEWLLETTTTAETPQLCDERANIVNEHYTTDPLCQSCQHKHKVLCQTCLFVLQSPLERQLYLALTNAEIKFLVQHGLNWQGNKISLEGKKYGDATNNFKEVLTVVDFYLEKGSTKLCVYTDGHTYHERTEEQAQRDRNIDRKLQELGFRVLRYTGKEVKENIESIVKDIKKWLN